MSSYADDLLNDLDSDEGEEEHQDQQQNGASAASAGVAQSSGEAKRERQDMEDDSDDGDDADGEGAQMEKGAMKLPENGVMPSEEISAEDVMELDFGPSKVKSVATISSLLGSTRLTSVVDKIEDFQRASASSSSASAPTQSEPISEHSEEYLLIVEANNLAVEVENETTLVHKFIRDHYSPRFPELDTVIPRNWEYVQAVEALGNPSDLSSPAKTLETSLARSLVVPISIAASTSKGRVLTEAEWSKVQEGIAVVHKLASTASTILSYVESRMNLIAPNLSMLVGSSVATKLLGISGGLVGLSKIPACNILNLGSNKKVTLGFSKLSNRNRHIGFVTQCPLMADVPPDFERQALRLIAAKVALVARVDANHSKPLGDYGAQLRRDLSSKIEKMSEPLPVKMVKALPVPSEGGNLKKRRGGRRARRMKEIYGISSLRQLANRVEFGEKAQETYTTFDETIGLGMAGSSSSGSNRVRGVGADAKTKATLSKKNQDRLKVLHGASGANHGSGGSRLENFLPSSSASSSSSSVGGLTTSLSFTPLQGIELSAGGYRSALPGSTTMTEAQRERQRAVDQANQKWFKGGAFSLAPSTSASSSTATNGTGHGDKSG